MLLLLHYVCIYIYIYTYVLVCNIMPHIFLVCDVMLHAPAYLAAGAGLRRGGRPDAALGLLAPGAGGYIYIYIYIYTCYLHLIDYVYIYIYTHTHIHMNLYIMIKRPPWAAPRPPRPSRPAWHVRAGERAFTKGDFVKGGLAIYVLLLLLLLLLL